VGIVPSFSSGCYISQVSPKSAQDHPESVGKWYWGLLESIQIKVDIGMAEWGLL